MAEVPDIKVGIETVGTLPAFGGEQAQSDRPPYVLVEPYFRDEVNGATYVHKDLVKTVEPWENEAHIGPTVAHERLGDVESFADYVKRYSASADSTFIEWGLWGMRAVLNYHQANGAGRSTWIADLIFEKSREWQAWEALCSGPQSQLAAVDKLEDLADCIQEPVAADLMKILRGLRANTRSEAVAEFTPEGDTKVTFVGESTVRASGDESLTVPSAIKITIPVLKGHTIEKDGKTVPVAYDMTVKVRPGVDANKHVQLRFSMPTADKVLEEVILERVATAKTALGDKFTVYRSAD